MSKYQYVESELNTRFLKIIATAKEKSKDDFKSIYLTKLVNANDSEKIRVLNKDIAVIKEKAKGFEVLPYFENSKNSEWQKNLYISRSTLLNTDEDSYLWESTYWGNLRDCLTKKVRKILESIEKYTYDDFLEGKVDSDRLNPATGKQSASREDYLKVSFWQIDNLIAIVTQEANQIIEQLISADSDFQIKHSTFQIDIKTYDKILAKKFNKPSELVTELKKLSFLRDQNLSFLDNKKSLFYFKEYKKSSIPWHIITPERINSINTNNQDNTRLFSGSPFALYTIEKVIQWMKELPPDTKTFSKIKIDDYSEILDKAIDEEQLRTVEKFQTYEDTNNIDRLSKKKRIQFYKDELDEIREQYNEEEKSITLEYFACLRNDNGLLHIFKTNCFFGGDVEEQTKHLKKAVYYETAFFHFIHKIWDLRKKPNVIYDKEIQGTSVSEIIFLTNSMVIDTKLYLKLRKVIDRFMSNTMVYALPFDIALRDTSLKMHDLFFEAIDQLLNSLSESQYVNKLYFIQTRLKELKQRTFQAKKYGNDLEDLQYTEFFKEFLTIEAD